MADTLFESVSLLLLGDGTNGSTTITDSSWRTKTGTAAAGAAISTTSPKFGSGSISFPNTAGNRVTFPNSAEYQFGAGDFTVEFWLNCSTVGSGSTIMQTCLNSTISGFAIRTDTNRIQFLSSHVAANWNADARSVAGSVVAGTWAHVACVRAGSTYTVYVNGTPGTPVTVAGTMTTNSNALYIGDNDVPNYKFHGYLEGVRITKGVARYTGAFAAPTAEFELGPVGALTFAGNAALQMACAFGQNTFISAPSPTVASYFGSTANVAAPAGATKASFGWNVAIAAPSSVLLSTTTETTGQNAAYLSAPAPSTRMHFGFGAALSPPQPALASGLTAYGALRAALDAPTGSVASSMRVSETMRGALTAPSGTFVGYGGFVIAVTAPSGGMVATGKGGGLLNGAITLPLFDLTSAFTADGMLSAKLEAPNTGMGAHLQAYLLPPQGVLTAIGTAVVAVSYEAYALNLNHRNPDSPDELTRYTNYPFDRIVRYENSYFGMNATGLYLLEGTTDFAEPTPTKVPWRFKTGLTDFESPNLKTVNWAYFGGRMAPAATISIHYGDTGEQNYAYSTPRGAEAQNYRQPFGRGIKSRYYAIEAEGSGALSIDSMMFDIASMARKV